jgi:hypothetical protein
MYRYVGFVALGAALLLGTQTSAEIMDLGGGWQAEFDPPLILSVTYVDSDIVVAFTEKTFPFENPGPMDITFTQTGESVSDFGTADRIIIDEATITNDTGMDWIGFWMATSGPATFNAEASTGFASEPFDIPFFTPDGHLALFAGGLLPDDGVWNPGAGPGGLRIDVDLSADSPVSFVLRQEAMAIPAPGSLVLLAFGGLLAVGRRRRHPRPS